LPKMFHCYLSLKITQLTDRHVLLDVTNWFGINRPKRTRVLFRFSRRGYCSTPFQSCRQAVFVSLFRFYAFIFNYVIRSALLKVLIVRNYLLPTVIKIGTSEFRRFMLTLVPWKALREIKEISDTMHRTSLEIFESKKALIEGDEVAMQAQGRNIISILCKFYIWCLLYCLKLSDTSACKYGSWRGK